MTKSYYKRAKDKRFALYSYYYYYLINFLDKNQSITGGWALAQDALEEMIRRGSEPHLEEALIRLREHHDHVRLPKTPSAVASMDLWLLLAPAQ